MNHPSADLPVSDAPGAPAPTPRQRLPFELILGSIWLALGLFALPAAIFGVGVVLLGPYGLGGGLGRFYADFFADLAVLSARAWAIALGPLVIISLMRLALSARRRKPAGPDPAALQNPPLRAARSGPSRIEPRVEVD